MNQPSPLRKLVAVAERGLTPPLQELYRSSPFGVVVGLGLKAERSVDRAVGSLTDRLWHAVNLPTYRDVTRVRELAAGLDRDVRSLARTLNDLESKDSSDAHIHRAS